MWRLPSTAMGGRCSGQGLAPFAHGTVAGYRARRLSRTGAFSTARPVSLDGRLCPDISGTRRAFVRHIGDLTQFQSFLRDLAACNAQLFNASDLACDLGLAVNTIKAWLSILEATFQIFILRPFHANLGKRLVKRPKVYFTDTGVLCCLSGLSDPDHAAGGPMGGGLLESGSDGSRQVPMYIGASSRGYGFGARWRVPRWIW